MEKIKNIIQLKIVVDLSQRRSWSAALCPDMRCARPDDDVGELWGARCTDEMTLCDWLYYYCFFIIIIIISTRMSSREGSHGRT